VEDVTGVILAGGKSRRMGRDKARLPVAGQDLFERVLAVLQGLFPRVLIAGDRPDLARPGLPAFADRYPGSALGGLYTGLQAAATPYIFVAACDMPHPDPELIRTLCALRQGQDLVVIRTADGLEPLFAVYGKNCLEPMRALLEAGNFRIYDFYDQVRVRYVGEEELPAGWRRALSNINTPQDYAALKEDSAMTLTVPVVSIVAKSGTGKTTLLEKLIVELKGRGYRIAAVKHDAHSFEIDHEGKDSWRLTQAGADTTIITSPAKVAVMKKNRPGQEPTLYETIATYCCDVDLVLTEGFKKSSMPKIEVHRAERSPTLLCRGEERDESLIAVASDEPLQLDVPVYDLNDAAGLGDFIVARFLK
jgi:molybdopterin-guanine dinucleotide biosynthesis protein